MYENLNGEMMKIKIVELHFHCTIDSPGEYAESKHFSVGLVCFSFEADVIAIV